MKIFGCYFNIFHLCNVKAQQKVNLKGLTKKEIKALKKQENEKKELLSSQVWD